MYFRSFHAFALAMVEISVLLPCLTIVSMLIRGCIMLRYGEGTAVEDEEPNLRGMILAMGKAISRPSHEAFRPR